MQTSHTSIELLDNTSEVDVSLQEIGNEFEMFPCGEKKRAGGYFYDKIRQQINKSGHQDSWNKAALFNPHKTSKLLILSSFCKPR